MVAVLEADSNSRPWGTMLATCFAFFIIQLDTTVVNVALPSLQRELEARPETLEWTLNAYLLAFGSILMLGGKLGDRFGRKGLYLVGVTVFALASVGCALSDTSGQLIAGRALQGVGAALLTPLSLALIAAAFPPARVAGAIGIWGAVGSLGTASGPILGGLLVEASGWAAVFWINVPIAVFVALVTLGSIRESRDPSIRSLDVPGTALVSVGLFAVLWGLIETNDHSFTAPEVLVFLAVGVALLASFVWWQARSKQPMLPLGLFARRAFSLSAVVALLAGFALLGAIYFITLYFQNVQGYDALDAGLRTLPATLPALVIAPLAGRFLARLGLRPFLAGGMVFLAAGFAGLTVLEPDTAYSQVWPFLILLGIGFPLVFVGVTAGAMTAAERFKLGIAAGALNAFRQAGSALGIAVLGALAASTVRGEWEARGGPDRLEELAVGGQTGAVERLAGPGAGELASEAFVQGLHLVAWGLIGLCLAAAAVVVVATRGEPRSPVAAPQP